MDSPLGLVRRDYSYDLPGLWTIVPHASWRGTYEMASFIAANCTTVLLPSSEAVYQDSTGQMAYPASGPDVSQSRCVEIDFPGKYQGMTRLLRRQTVAGPIAWMGSLMQDAQDASGLMFRRNRYYDPSSGRFTQEDPIGLAGGVNAYGFAGGDPVSFSDPYGLCPIPPWDCPAAVLAYTAKFGDEAVDFWADRAQSSSGAARAGSVVAGHFAALWTTETHQKTLHVLRTGWEMGRDAVRNASGPNQMENDPRKPRTVDHVHPAYPGTEDAQPHIHFHRMRETLNKDGTWGHGADPNNPPTLTREEKRWVKSHGWKTEPDQK
ncbi:MAG TPA: RHS repeat-associated core domain-containing protein [Longimicrobium sp.]|nr:RHS repeat-associated core domain-containing protein [Longimicrobium sp.]